MRQTTLAVFAIVAIAAMMGAASVAPAYAAKLTVNTTTVKESSMDFPMEVCGADPVVMLTTTTLKLHMWDTGKVKLHQVTTTTFTDAAGNIVGQGIAVTNEITKVDKLPMTITQENDGFKCIKGETSSFEHNNHSGHTTKIDKDGTVTIQSHGS